MKWRGTDLDQIVHYLAEGREFADCGVYAASMTADTYHAVTRDRDAVTCDACKKASAEGEQQ